MHYSLSGLFQTHFFPSISWILSCQEQYWFRKKLGINKDVLLCVYFLPGDSGWRSSFQKQVKDVRKEMEDCLLKQDSVRTLSGAPMVMDLPCCLLRRWTLHRFLWQQPKTGFSWANWDVWSPPHELGIPFLTSCTQCDKRGQVTWPRAHS